ncbi:MAG: hypothetical protein Q7V17_08265 [Afipia sp.]|nr:hypothetical protein [Afipia sp.]
MAALPGGEAIPAIDHLTFRAVLPKTRGSRGGRHQVQANFRENDHA